MKNGSKILFITTVKEERDKPTDETVNELLLIVHAPSKGEHVVLADTVSYEGGDMNNDVKLVEKEESIGKGVLIVIVKLEFS